MSEKPASAARFALRIGASAGPDQRPGDADWASCGDLDIRIAADGTWFYRGSPIGRPALVKLFATVLRRDAHGDYWLVTPAERGRVIVDDAPFTAVELRRRGRGRSQVLEFRTNIDRWIEAGATHPIRVALAPGSGEPRPYIMIGDGLEALILRPVYYQLADIAVRRWERGRSAQGVWSNGAFFPLNGES